MKNYQLSIITPEETVFSGAIQRMVLPSVMGEMEVLADHAPAFIMLSPGVIRVHVDGSLVNSYRVEGGYVQIVRGAVKILPEHITLLQFWDR